jgi:cytochrome o ubiquinol oxidase operon protein cyoD
MSGSEENPLLHGEVQQASVLGYTAAFLVTLLLLGIGLLMTKFHVMPPSYLLGSLAGLAFIALLCQAFLSFGLDITRHNIWKSVSLVLTVPLFILTIGLTAWMFQQLAINTMIPDGNSMQTMSMPPSGAP